MLLVAFLPIKAANSFSLHHSNQVSYWLPDLQDQKLLTLSWRSFSEWGGEHVAFSFANKGVLDLIHECLQPIATQITQNSRPKFIDAALMLIFRMG